MWNLIRWVSPRTIKETFVPADATTGTRSWRTDRADAVAQEPDRDRRAALSPAIGVLDRSIAGDKPSGSARRSVAHPLEEPPHVPPGRDTIAASYPRNGSVGSDLRVLPRRRRGQRDHPGARRRRRPRLPRHPAVPAAPTRRGVDATPPLPIRQGDGAPDLRGLADPRSSCGRLARQAARLRLRLLRVQSRSSRSSSSSRS